MNLYNIATFLKDEKKQFSAFGIVLVFFILMFNSCTYYNDQSRRPVLLCTDTANVSYKNTVATIISTNCYTGCHDGPSPTSGYPFDSYAGLTGFLTANTPPMDVNHFIGSIEWIPPHPHMPNNGQKLSDCDITKLVAWINQGMKNN